MLKTIRNIDSTRVRPAAAAGTFYPADGAVLRRVVTGFLREANRIGPTPKALIAPHAGYPYSGPVAASGYALLKPARDRIQRVVLVGPSHRLPFHGLAAPSVEAFATPLGVVPIDRAGVQKSLEWSQVQVLDEAHRHEHSLEVQLPFLQLTLDQFAIVPLAVGEAYASEVADVINSLWGSEETLVVVSSDLSHYHDYWTARAIDSETSNLIENGQWQQLSGQRACGYGGIRGLLKVALKRRLRIKTVDLRNSGDTSGNKEQVVGYGSYVIY